MKKTLSWLLVLVFAFCVCAMAETADVMTYADYNAAELDTEVTVVCYVQAHQSWWNDTVTVYAADADGAYFIYNLACSAEDAEKLVPGTAIKVNGYKSAWSGEVEIIDGKFEFVEAEPYIAEPIDVTALLGTDELINYQNSFVTFKGMTVERAAIYRYDGSGADGDDLYFKVTLDGKSYTFLVESYLCDNTTEVYAAVKALNVGDVIDMEGFLYWYEGVQAHITAVTAAE